MKITKLKKRLNPKRSMTAITMRMPDDVIADLKHVAPHKRFSGYQPLIRAYIGQDSGKTWLCWTQNLKLKN